MNTGSLSTPSSARAAASDLAHLIGLGVEREPGHDAGDGERRRRLADEERRLRVWAREAHRLTERLPGEDARGGEHTVLFQEPTQRILRTTRPETRLGYGLGFGSYLQGATPSEYLDRWAWHNHLFGDDVRLECVVATAGRVMVVTSQPFIRGRDATAAEITAFMLARGFDRIGAGAFHHPHYGLLADDLYPRNAKVSARGVVLPIDPVLQRITPEFAEFLRDHYYPAYPDEAGGGDLPASNIEKEHAPPVPALPRRKLTGLELKLDTPTEQRVGRAFNADLLRERFRQPRVTRRAALRQIAATLPLSAAARAELDTP